MAGQRGLGAVVVRSLTLEPEGARLVARVDHSLCRGEVVLRLRIEPPRQGRQTLRVVLERGPEGVAEVLEPFRGIFASAQMNLEIETLSPPGEPTPVRA
ncbi:MAG: hypothetical protein OEW39_08855 [Deltaproteobacteria bacterium]|nr:hypothetical protein [Deltaproteobacteria bacterium]